MSSRKSFSGDFTQQPGARRLQHNKQDRRSLSIGYSGWGLESRLVLEGQANLAWEQGLSLSLGHGLDLLERTPHHAGTRFN